MTFSPVTVVMSTIIKKNVILFLKELVGFFFFRPLNAMNVG